MYRERGDPYHTVYHVSGRRSLDPIPFCEHHRKGKQPVVVAHYPRLDALLARSRPQGVSAAAIEYTKHRLRQEVRFRREAIRRCIGPGSATVGAVLGSFPAFVRAAERRLRPITQREGILSLPRVDHESVEALLAVDIELQRAGRAPRVQIPGGIWTLVTIQTPVQEYRLQGRRWQSGSCVNERRHAAGSG